MSESTEGKLTKRFESAQESHLFLNDIEDSCAKEFIISMFHEIENLHLRIKKLESISK